MEKKEHDHKFEFQDILDTGEDICKIHVCECGAKMIDVYVFTTTEYEEGR